MELDKSIEYHKKTEPDNKSDTSKVFTTQNVIRNKFEKARMVRLEFEHEADRTIKPITSNAIASTSRSSNDSTYKKNNFSLQTQSQHDIPVRINENNECNINALCKRLRLLLSSPIASSAKHTQEMNSILDELYVLGAII